MTKPATVRLASVNDRTSAAELAYLSFRDFYDLVPAPHERIIELVAQQIGLAGTELAQSHVAELEGELAGMYAACTAVKLKSAQMLSVAKLASALPDRQAFLRAVDEFRQRIPALDASSGLYLSRIAVSRRFQRRGVGGVLLQHFLDAARGDAWLHVHDSNTGALAFYRSHGFHEVSRVQSGYRLLCRDAVG